MPIPPAARAARWKTGAVAGVALAYLACAFLLDHDSWAWTDISYLLFALLGFLAGWAALAAARATTDPGLSIGLRFYAASHACTAVGNLAWLGIQLAGGDPTYSWANLLYLVSYPMVVAGVLSFPRQRHRAVERWRIVTDGAIAVLAGIILTWLLVVQPLGAGEPDLFRRALLFAYPVGDLLIFVVLIPFLLDPVTPASGAVLPRLAVGQVLYLTGDLGYVLGAGGPAWLRVDWPDLLSMAGYLGMTWAMEAVFQPHPGPVEPRRRVTRSPVPFLLGAAVYLMLLYEAWDAAVPGMLTLALVMGMVTLLILMRERFTEQENLRLTGALEVARAEARFRAVIEHLSVGVVVQDLATGVALANPAALRLLGVTLEELQRRPLGEPGWDVVREDGTQILPADRPVVQAVTTGRPVTNTVLGVSQPPGAPRVWLLVSANPLVDADGRLAEVLVGFQDITERRDLEGRLRQAQRMEAVGQLAGGVAHDFNNLLTAIIGYSSVVQRDLMEDGARMEDVAEIRAAAERAAALTQQLLAFGRRQLLQPEVLSINDVVRDAERLLRRLLGEDIRIVSRLAPNLPAVRVDRGQLEQVIINLAVNARDAMPQGGELTLHTTTEDGGGPGDATWAPPAGAVLLSVHDTGHGMDEMTRAQAFDPFFTTKPVGKGTGLGLSTVYGIVRQSGGEVRLESEPGLGTTVRLWLPAAEAVPEARETTPVPLPPPGRETILVVEDEPALLRVMQRTLESRGYEVHVAASPAAARAWLAEHPRGPDLLLTDVVMPGGSGPELAAELHRALPGLPTLFISGYADEATLRYGLDQENATLLSKPFSPDALAARVRAVLDQAG